VPGFAVLEELYGIVVRLRGQFQDRTWTPTVLEGGPHCLIHGFVHELPFVPLGEDDGDDDIVWFGLKGSEPDAADFQELVQLVGFVEIGHLLFFVPDGRRVKSSPAHDQLSLSARR
jgi:hypothetical protein